MPTQFPRHIRELAAALDQERLGVVRTAAAVDCRFHDLQHTAITQPAEKRHARGDPRILAEKITAIIANERAKAERNDRWLADILKCSCTLDNPR